MVRVEHSGHGIDFEVLVRTNGCGILNSSPVSEGRLGIIEPLVADVLDMVRVHLGKAGCDFTASNISIKDKHVLSNSFVAALSAVCFCHKIVVDCVASSYNLDIIDVVTIDCWHTDSAIVHLSYENLISEEIIAEKTVVRTSDVVIVSNSDIWQVSNK